MTDDAILAWLKQIAHSLESHNGRLSEHMRKSDVARQQLNIGLAEVRQDACDVKERLGPVEAKVDSLLRTRKSALAAGGAVLTVIGGLIVAAWNKILASFPAWPG